MFESGPNYTKLKTNLRLAVNRLKLLEKKKTELALKARKEIADYIAAGKAERAKIRVEQIIREDYLVEAMELLEMYCDLLLARFGLVQQMKTLDDGLAEAISSLIWVAPRLQADVAELKIIAEQLGVKYGKPYATACRDNAIGTVAPKLMHKLSVQAPPKILVEKYLIEIAKNYSVEYEPDPQVMRAAAAAEEALLIDFNATEAGKLGDGGMLPAPGWIDPTNSQQPMPNPPSAPLASPNYGLLDNAMAPPPPYGYPLPPVNPPNQGGQQPVSPFDNVSKQLPPNIPPNNLSGSEKPKPTEKSPTDTGKSLNSNMNSQVSPPKPSPRKTMNTTFDANDLPDLPELPSVPVDNIAGSSGGKEEDDDIDFDDLTRRFEELKKRK